MISDCPVNFCERRLLRPARVDQVRHLARLGILFTAQESWNETVDSRDVVPRPPRHKDTIEGAVAITTHRSSLVAARPTIRVIL